MNFWKVDKVECGETLSEALNHFFIHSNLLSKKSFHPQVPSQSTNRKKKGRVRIIEFDSFIFVTL